MNMHNKLPDPATADVYAFDGVVTPQAPANRRWLKPLLIGLGVLLAAFVGYRLFAPKPAPPPAVSQVPEITVVVPGSTLVADQFMAPGSIAARRDAGVGVNGEGGRVVAVLVDPGQSVAKGQVLARIDAVVQQQQSIQLAASVRQAQADAKLADANLNRAQALVSKGFISKADIDSRTATRDSANARVAVARAQLAENQARIERLNVRAPAAGLVLARNVEAGQVVSPGSGALFRIAEGGVLEMRAQVAEQDLAKLKVGMPASVTPTGSTTEYPGKVWLLDPVIDAASRQGIARIAVPYAPGLRVGAFAKVRIDAGEARHPMLPQSAMQADERGSFVMIIGADNKAARRAVTVGRISDDGVAIMSGLTGNERVVVSAGAFLREGEMVKPLRAGKAS